MRPALILAFAVSLAAQDPRFDVRSRLVLVPATVTDAKGDAAKPGWFFVLQETPGETRFGLDISGPAGPTRQFTWDDASWDLVTGGKISVTGSAPDPKITAFEGNLEVAASQKARWGRSSADMVYILYQKPVMIAIHAN